MRSSMNSVEFCLFYLMVVCIEVAACILGYHIIMMVPGMGVIKAFAVFYVPFLMCLSVIVLGLPIYMKQMQEVTDSIMGKDS